MSARHYSPEAPFGGHQVERVAVYCGAITHHSVPQRFVWESSYIGYVTCKNCRRRYERG